MESIVIRETEQKSKRDGTLYWQVTDINGRKISIWDKSQYDDLTDKIGQSVNVEIEQKGAFFNLKGINTNLSVKSASQPVPASNKDNSIVAQCLTKCVCEICKDSLKQVPIIEVREIVLEVYTELLNELSK